MRFHLFVTVCFSVLFSLLSARGVFAAHPQELPVRPEFNRAAEVSIWSADFLDRTRFQTFPKTQIRGGFIASGDVTGDGKSEIVIGGGTGAAPEVRVYDTTGKLLNTFLAYASSFKGGVRVAVGDLDGDGKAEIVTAPGPGGGPHIRVFDGSFRNVGLDLFAFNEQMADGIVPTILRTPEGPVIAVGIESWSEPIVKLFRQTAGGGFMYQSEFLAFDRAWHSGVSIAAFDRDGDGFDEIAAHGNGGSKAEIRIFSRGGELSSSYLVQDAEYRGGLSIAQIDSMSGSRPELASVVLAPLVSGPLNQEKAIHVNLAEQRLYAYERGRIARTYLISSGTVKYPTPVMDTWVRSKVAVKRYRWSYGLNHKDNYDLPNVKWNLQILGPYFIHGAYWHNNFGHRMSHGCINMRTSEAEWVYQWADVGTPVRTFYKYPPQDEVAKELVSKSS